MCRIVIHWLLIALAGMSTYSFAQTDIETPKIQWRFKTEGPIRGDSVVHNDMIVFGSADGYLYALNRYNGDLRWKVKTAGAIVGTPAIKGNLVVISSRDGFVYGVNADTGRRTWRFNMKPDLGGEDTGWQYFTAAPVIVNNRVYVGSGDGHLYTLDAARGQLIWKFRTQGPIRAAPLVAKGKIYQPSNDGFIYVLNAHNGNLLWKFETAGATLNSSESGFDRNSIYTQPILQGRKLLVGSRDGNVYAIDTVTRQQAWNFSYGTTWAMSSSADNHAVYVGWSTNNLISAVDIASGTELWKFQAGAYVYTAPLLSESSVYVGSADGKLYRLNKATGEKVWEYDLQREIYSSPVFAPDSATLFVGNDSGYFYAIENGMPAHKAVYLPETIEGILQYTVIDGKVTAYLTERNFDQLGTEDLQQFLNARIADQAPSVIVFALPFIPENIMGADPAQGLMRQYLESGGKVVWFGDAPNYWEVGSNGDFTRSVEQGAELLDVEYFDANESGNYFGKTTQQGRNWGLPKWLKTTATPVRRQGVTPLAFDEFHRVSAYVKKFNDRPGSGFVSLRTWAWYVPVRDEDLALIHEAAVYGLE